MAHTVALSLAALLPSIGILLLLILTVVAFWPMNAALYYHGIGSPKDTITDAQSVAMARRWVTLDWVRVTGAAAAFVAPLRALTLPWPAEMARKDPPLIRVLLALALLGVAGFVIWFVLNLRPANRDRPPLSIGMVDREYSDLGASQIFSLWSRERLPPPLACTKA